MAIASLVLFALLLTLSHTLIRSHQIRSVLTTNAADGSDLELRVIFYQTNLDFGSFVIVKAETGLRVNEVIGSSADDSGEVTAALDKLITATMRTPLRRDTLIPNLIAILQVLIPTVLAVLFIQYLRQTRHQLAESNLCLNCAYSLEGIEQSRCPECGQLRS